MMMMMMMMMAMMIIIQNLVIYGYMSLLRTLSCYREDAGLSVGLLSAQLYENVLLCRA